MIFSEIQIVRACRSCFGLLAQFQFEDLTKSTSITVSEPIPAVVYSSIFSGQTAEWIMERPGFQNSLPDLADYSQAEMFSAVAETQSGESVSFADAWTPYQITMSNPTTEDALSTVTPAPVRFCRIGGCPDSAMIFTWDAFH